MIRRAVDRIKRLSYEVLEEHKSKFGEDFADNKKILDQISIIRSKGLKNEVAGYITKFIKREIREEKMKQSQIDAAESEEENQEIPQTEISETEETPVEIVAETTTVDESAEATEEKTE